jgi:hypothetical protein
MESNINNYFNFIRANPDIALSVIENIVSSPIEYDKQGNKIHIKKSHKNLFTNYCNGKVTNECIERGKQSSDPKVRKRATFA